jgi:hypothetical protein
VRVCCRVVKRCTKVTVGRRVLGCRGVCRRGDRKGKRSMAACVLHDGLLLGYGLRVVGSTKNLVGVCSV